MQGRDVCVVLDAVGVDVDSAREGSTAMNSGSCGRDACDKRSLAPEQGEEGYQSGGPVLGCCCQGWGSTLLARLPIYHVNA
eukprot:1160947-Pelagomonas_calceolata.AAC.9